LFVDGIDPVNWDLLNNSEDKPLNNRALRGQYPPGSTIKPFMALAALENGKRTPEYSIIDPGYWMLPGLARPYRDWKKGGHGVVNMHKSIVVSCDTYYYGLGNDLGIDRINAFMTPFGFGSKNGIDIDGELTGLMPSQEWKQKRFKQKWYAVTRFRLPSGRGTGSRHHCNLPQRRQFSQTAAHRSHRTCLKKSSIPKQTKSAAINHHHRVNSASNPSI
jgi:penicillin-binding protein 2